MAAQEIRDERRLDLDEDPDADSENDDGYNSPCEDKQGEDESDESRDLEGDSPEMDEDATNVAGQGNKLKAQKKCDYELKRDANIRRNRELLQELDDMYGFVGSGQKGLKASRNAKK